MDMHTHDTHMTHTWHSYATHIHPHVVKVAKNILSARATQQNSLKQSSIQLWSGYS